MLLALLVQQVAWNERKANDYMYGLFIAEIGSTTNFLVNNVIEIYSNYFFFKREKKSRKKN